MERPLFFSQMEVVKYSLYQDLYLYDLTRSHLRRLTNGERLIDPDFHPDGKQIICVKNQLGKSNLIIYDLHTGHKEVLDWIGHEASRPRWSPDGRSLVVTVGTGASQGLEIIRLADRSITPIVIDSALDIDPTWSKDGKYLVFSSDRSGIFNLYAYAISDQSLFRITNVIGGAFTPEVTATDIIFSNYNSHGTDLHKMRWDPTTWKRVATPVVARSEPLPQAENKLLISEKYSPWETLRPRFWIPSYYVYSDEIKTYTKWGFSACLY